MAIYIHWTNETYSLTPLYIPAIGLSFLKKIKYEYVHLTSFSKMRVNLAAQVDSCMAI